MRWLLLLAAVGCQGVDGPTVDGVTPAAARIGADVVIAGRGFCGDRPVDPDGACAALPSGYASFGLEPPMIRAEVRTWTDTAIVAVVSPVLPYGRSTEVYVTVDGRSSNAVDLEVLP